MGVTDNIHSGVAVPSESTPNKRSISVVVTAMNEEGNLEPAVEIIHTALASRFSDYEIIIVNDGSTDGTPAIADQLAARKPHVRVHHNPSNLGLHIAYLTGIKLANKEYISVIAGNNMLPSKALEDVFDAVGRADLVLSYLRADKRPMNRVLISRSLTLLLNTLFGLRLRYYSGPCVYRAVAGKRVRSVARGSMIMPEIVIRLLRAGQSHVEVAIDHKVRTAGRTKTFRFKNVVAALSGVLRLFIDIQLRRNIMPTFSGEQAVGVEPKV
jgi:glycosyltransferase involved in cell wall biosynthesis